MRRNASLPLVTALRTLLFLMICFIHTHTHTQKCSFFPDWAFDFFFLDMKTFAFYRNLQHYFLKGEFTSTVGRRDRVLIRQASSNFVLKDNRLFYTGPSRCYMRLVVLSEVEKMSVLVKCHSNHETGYHHGIRKTKDKVIAGYYWPTLAKDVTDWVNSCRRCQLKNSTKRAVRVLDSIKLLHRSQKITDEEISVGAELEIDEDEKNTTTKPAFGTCGTVIPKHYDTECSSEDEGDDIGQTCSGTSTDYICCVCGSRFMFLDDLIQHFTEHKSEVRCHLCQVTFSRVISLALHLQYAHASYHLICKICRVTCHNLWNLNEHLEKHNLHHIEVVKSRKTVASLLKEKQLKEKHVEEIIIESEHMEKKNPNDGEYLVIVRNVEDRDTITPHTTENYFIQSSMIDHSYCAQKQPNPKEPDSAINASNFTASNFEADSKLFSDNPELDGSSQEKIVVARQSLQKGEQTIFPHTTEDYFMHNFMIDHGYCAQRQPNPKDSDRRACIQKQYSNIKAIVDSATNSNIFSLHASNFETDTELFTEKIVVACQSLQKGDQTCIPPKSGIRIKTRETTHNTSLSYSEKLDPAQLELSIEIVNKEDHLKCGGDKESVWDVQEVVINEEEEAGIIRNSDQENRVPKPLCEVMYVPNEVSDSSTDGVYTAYKSNIPENGWQRLCGKRKRLGTESQQKHTCKKTNQKLSSRPQVNAAPNPSSSKDLQICRSCSISKSPTMEKTAVHCSCRLSCKCVICGAVCETVDMLWKHCSENHPSVFLKCSGCLKMFHDHNTFMKHVCSRQFSLLAGQTILGNGVSPVDSTKYQAPVTWTSTAVRQSSKQTQIVNTEENVPPTSTQISNNILGVNAVQNVGAMSDSASKSLLSLVSLKESVIPLTSISSITLTKPGQGLVLTPTNTCMMAPPPSTVSVKPKFLQGTVLSQHRLVPATSPPVHSPMPATVSGSATTSTTATSHQPKVNLHMLTYPSATTTVSVSVSSAPVFTTPSTISANSMHMLPNKVQVAGNLKTVTPSFSEPAPLNTYITASSVGQTQAPAVYVSSSCDSCPAAQALLSPSGSPLRIVGLFVNQSQQLALQRRMHQSWRTKAIIPCRQCGAISRQPSLSVRHRYQHRGPRPYICQCGRTFQRRLYLLRHQVQHAEAMRYVCATCGETFMGTHLLAYHKQNTLCKIIAKNGKIHNEKECRNVFPCHCGQTFTKPAALLWHILKNSSKRSGRHLTTTGRRTLNVSLRAGK